MVNKKEWTELKFPDSNLVGLIKRFGKAEDYEIAVDFGCGGGRHLKILNGAGYYHIVSIEPSEEARKACSEETGFEPFMSAAQAVDFVRLNKEPVGLLVAWGITMLPNVHPDIFAEFNPRIIICDWRTSDDCHCRTRQPGIETIKSKDLLNGLDYRFVDYQSAEIKGYEKIYACQLDKTIFGQDYSSRNSWFHTVHVKSESQE